MNIPELENNPLLPPKKPKKSNIHRIIKLIILLAIGFWIWGMFFPPAIRTSEPASLDQAEFCPIPLPSSAKNIQFYWRNHLIEFVEFVKFEAPPQDCLDHVQVVLDDWRETFSDRQLSVEPPSAIEEPPRRMYLAKERGVDWFDPENIQEGMAFGGGGSGVPRIWVDTQRGIFYYCLTD